MIDIKQYLEETNTVLLTKEAFECLKERASALDKIRAEIEQLPTTKCTETYRISINATDFKENVLAILDKYKAESEEQA